MEWGLAYIALGLFTGFSAGMLGIGGGLVMVPTLTMMFTAQAGFPAAEALHMALGTSMATILFTSLSSLRAHHRHEAVLWRVVFQIAPGILFGTLVGTLFASRVPARPLAVFFTLFVCFVAVQMILNLKPKAARELPGALGVFGVPTFWMNQQLFWGEDALPMVLYCARTPNWLESGEVKRISTLPKGRA